MIVLVLLSLMLFGILLARIQLPRDKDAAETFAEAPMVTAAPAEVSAEVTAAPTAEPTATAAPTATPEPTPVPEPEYFTISMVGDCTLSASADKVSWGIGYQSVVGKNYAYPFANTVEYLSDDYLTIANLECNLSDKTYTSPTYEWFTFLSPAAYANILKEGSVEFATIANNHTMDFGTAAYEDTELSLKAAGIAYAGEDETYIYEADGGLKIGLYCLYNQLTANALDLLSADTQKKIVSESKGMIDKAVKSLQEQGAEYLLICLHMGKEGYYEPTDEQTEICRYAVDAGFDAVYCSHAHRLQPAEMYNDCPIFYGLGNWSFGGHTNPGNGNDKGAYDTGIAKITVCRTGDQVETESYDFIPCCIGSGVYFPLNANSINNYQPTPYEENSDNWNRAMSMINGTYEGANYTVNYGSVLSAMNG